MKNSPAFATDTFLLDNPNDLISLDKWQKTVNLLAKLFDAPAGFLVQYTKEGFQVTISSEQESNPYASGVVIEPEVNIFCRKIVET
ncbi:sensor domain-containing diguanylate cyclase, partial [Shewanella sp. 0m-11]